jgi:hypothetical protein
MLALDYNFEAIQNHFLISHLSNINAADLGPIEENQTSPMDLET